MNYIKQYEGIPFKNVKDKGFAPYVLEKVHILATKYNTLNITLDSLPDLPRHPQRKEILREISEKLTAYYGEKVDAISWFLVLYHGNDIFERYTYRDIARLLGEMGITHTGKNGQQNVYHDTSIAKVLAELWWESHKNTTHTESGRKKKALKKTIENNTKIIALTETIKTTLPTAIPIPVQSPDEYSTQYAKKLLEHIRVYYPDIDTYGWRVKAKVLNLLVSDSIFTSDSFR